MSPKEIQAQLGDIDVSKYERLQESLASNVIKEDELPENIRYIAGADVAYDTDKEEMIGAIVVLDVETLEVVAQASHRMGITFPYIPGLFSFREIPALIEAYKKLEIKADVLVCDGQGIAHPKQIGMASHLGLVLDIPTIGCAKKRLVGAYDSAQLGTDRGAIFPLLESEETLGVALRTQEGVKPMFVSIGHKISLASAIKWVLHLCRDYRLPETTRQADQLVNQLRKG